MQQISPSKTVETAQTSNGTLLVHRNNTFIESAPAGPSIDTSRYFHVECNEKNHKNCVIRNVVIKVHNISTTESDSDVSQESSSYDTAL